MSVLGQRGKLLPDGGYGLAQPVRGGDAHCWALSEAERAARQDAKRRQKEEKKATREEQRVRNALRCDERAHVRIAAFAALNGTMGEVSTSNIQASTAECNEAGTASVGPDFVSLFGLNLCAFSLELLPSSWGRLTSLDLSHNKLSGLPGLENLVSLVELNLCRNSFCALPSSLRQLPNLAKLNASRNSIRPNAAFMVLLLQAPGLPSLQELDITFNKKCYTQDLAELLATELPTVAVRITVTYPRPPGAYVGDSPATRDATVLRSQLEPYTTLQLRQRLAITFGHGTHSMFGAPPEARADVMQRLLECYAKAGNERRLVRVNGSPVSSDLIDRLFVEVREWSARLGENHQERPMIHAEKYMIIRSPVEFEQKLRMGSSKAAGARKKYEQNTTLWQCARAAMATVDPEFAATFTGLAVTQGFRGSPHIDTTNLGPFYGLSFGDFADGTGGIRVELDPMTVAEVNTKNRLCKIDGRFPHWVAPYDESCERFSLIYYQTEGKTTPQTSAVFGTIQENIAEE
eukprot:TRINITY_DN33629_c0_g1_i1.p1 TRINITY_DN33629_c0_g1~~TRINITY_DN33629_c0_g1_i1.p1  ORF type:complete len:519 (+),score=25.52 TRINITY_DN33629_c0_g1_i1:39-1595(+)